MILSSTKKIIVVAASLALGSVVTLLALLWLVNRLAVSHQENLSQLANVEALRELSLQTQRLLQNTEEERSILQSLVLEEDDIVDFLAEIETEARKLGVDLRTEQLDKTSGDQKTFADLNIVFEFKGSSTGVLRLLNMIELMPYAHRLSNFQYDTRGGVWEGTMGLVMNIWYEK